MSKNSQYDQLIRAYTSFYSTKPIRNYWQRYLKSHTTPEDIKNVQLPTTRMTQEMKQAWITQFNTKQQNQEPTPSAKSTFGCDGYECPKCGSQDVIQRTVQTRSIDEPSKQFFFCNNSKCQWKWCED